VQFIIRNKSTYFSGSTWVNVSKCFKNTAKTEAKIQKRLKNTFTKLKPNLILFYVSRVCEIIFHLFILILYNFYNFYFFKLFKYFVFWCLFYLCYIIGLFFGMQQKVVTYILTRGSGSPITAEGTGKWVANQVIGDPHSWSLWRVWIPTNPEPMIQYKQDYLLPTFRFNLSLLSRILGPTRDRRRYTLRRWVGCDVRTGGRGRCEPVGGHPPCCLTDPLRHVLKSISFHVILEDSSKDSSSYSVPDPPLSG